MRVVVVGASGNMGTSVLGALGREPAVDSVIGVARRRPGAEFDKTEWVQADMAKDDLTPLLRGADAVVHVAWLLQPTRDRALLRRVNVEGSTRLLAAARAAGVKAIAYASSIGAYSPGPKDRAVDETWPTEGIATNEYALEKAEVERRLDRFEREAPEIRVVRFRPALTFKYESASQQRRLFAGPFLPSPLVRRELVPVLPDIPRLRFQGVHSHDVGEAFRLAVVSDGRGAFNLAAEPPLDMARLAELFDARLVRVPARALRAAAAIAWRLRVTPIPETWLDLALGVPLMDVRRAREELGWTPRHTALEAIEDVVRGIREGAGLDTPPLASDAGGPARVGELLTGVGARDRA
jgi:UDP-glucose 4-epimerase